MNLLNVAYAVGLSSCWIHRSTEMFELAEGKELLKEWGFSEDMKAISSIALGYADCDSPVAAVRRDNRIIRV